jgi:putative peptidoglycan lipid II flippase
VTRRATSSALQRLTLSIGSPHGYNASVKRQTIVAGASIMMVASLLSRLLGWVRDRAIGHFWGSTSHTDAFWAAFNVPDLLYYLLAGGALGAAVIPVFSGYLRRSEDEESWYAANTIVTLLVLLAGTGILAIIIFAPALVLVVAPGFARRDPAAAAECAGYVRIIAPMVIFTVLSALFTGILQSHRHFTAPAAAWLVYNVGIIAGAFAGGLWAQRHYGQVAGLRVVALGVLAGAVLLVLVQVPSMWARGFRFRPALDLKHPAVREVIRLFLPYMAGLAFTQICLLLLPILFGSYFPQGVTSLRYANRLVVLPLGVFGVAISTAAFPALAARIDAGEIAEFRSTFSASLRAIFFLSVPSAAALVVLAGPILRLLWRSGAFNETAVDAATFSLLFYAAALIGLSGLQVVNRAFYSLRDVRTPPLVGIGYTIIIVVLAIGLMRTRLQYAAIAAATSVGVNAGFLVMFECLRRRLGGVEGRAILSSFLRVAVASAALAAVSLLVARWCGHWLQVPVTRFVASAPPVDAVKETAVTAASFSRVAAQVITSMTAGSAAYLAALRLLGAPELESFRQVLRRRRGVGAQAAPIG